MKKFLAGILSITFIVFFFFGFMQRMINLIMYQQVNLTTTTPNNNQVVCTQEVKLCPDGKTYVSRTGPKCEFTACP